MDDLMNNLYGTKYFYEGKYEKWVSLK